MYLFVVGRTQRAAGKTTTQGVIPLYYSTSDFEQSKKNIIDFTEAIRSRNRDTNQRELSKDDSKTSKSTKQTLNDRSPQINNQASKETKSNHDQGGDTS